MTRFARRPALILFCLAGLAGCDTFDHFQQPPKFSGPGAIKQIPPSDHASEPFAASGMTDMRPALQGSLWRPGARTFFRDPRARGIGDLLTVAVNLQEQAEFANDTTLSRTTANGMTISNLFGLGGLIGHIIPGLANTNPTINTSGNDSTTGQGDIKRSENIVVNVAATVVEVLPNHNFEIAGSQEIRLNNELRQLQIRGIVRPEDIASDNTISSERVAEARIEYGGRGVSSDLQRPTWGQDVLTRLAPF
jgi:flagellar L-ring protein precursor FlgH